VKLLFVAGNESADQGRDTMDFRGVAVNARERGIVVSTLYAGGHQQGIRDRWKEVADVGAGAYAAIDMIAGTFAKETPVDARLEALNQALNGTYIPWGKQGQVGYARQAQQDARSGSRGLGSLAARVSTKGAAQYDNSHWDLVDATDKSTIDLGRIAPADLPPGWAKLSVEEREATLLDAKNKRTTLKQEIAAAGVERQRWLESQTDSDAGAALDAAMAKVFDAHF
jgi:hypothetical protein